MFLKEAFKFAASDWQAALQQELLKDYFFAIENFLQQEISNGEIIFPTNTQIFAALHYTSLTNTKVVILGQDPYHTINMADGLSFSASTNKKLPPSLKNIFKELHTDLLQPINTNGNLNHWAKQGVLLLNTCLTVKCGIANSHSNIGWQYFTTEIIRILNAHKSNVVFILWGKNAQAIKPLIDSTNHLVLEAAHPSPLSAHNGFWGCNHFSKTNKYLAKHNLQTIDWQIV